MCNDLIAVMTDAVGHVGLMPKLQLYEGGVKASPKRDYKIAHSWGHRVKAAAVEVCLLDGKIWSSHMKGPPLAEEEVLSNSIGYYYRRRLNRSLKNTQTVFSQQRDWHARI